MPFDSEKVNRLGKKKKRESFFSDFRKGFGGGKDRKSGKPRSKTTGQKLNEFFKGK